MAESSAVIRSRRQVVGMLFAVVVFFFACILPFKLLTLWIVASPFDIMVSHSISDNFGVPSPREFSPRT